MANTHSMRWLGAASVAVTVFVGIRAGAMERMAVPSFGLTAADGHTVQSDQMPHQGKWLLIYVQPHCGPCDALLNLVKKEQLAGAPEQVLVVVGGTLDDVSAVQHRFPDLAAVSWYADPNKSAFTELKLQGVPVVLGVRQDTIEWSVAGILGDDAHFKSII